MPLVTRLFLAAFVGIYDLLPNILKCSPFCRRSSWLQVIFYSNPILARITVETKVIHIILLLFRLFIFFLHVTLVNISD